MAVGSITKRAVDAVVSGAKDSFLWDEEVKGFGLKVTPAGGRTYIYQYRSGGRGTKVSRCTIGPHGHWTPDQARREARRLAQLVDQGMDPAAQAKIQKREAIDFAFPVYAERFIKEYLEIEWKGGHGLASGILRRDAMPAFRSKTVKNITRSDVSTLLDKFARMPAKRRNAFAVLRRLFKWAANRGDIELSPLRDMEAPLGPRARDRTLGDDELARVWEGSLQLGFPFGPFVQILALTGQRRVEVAGLDWSELDRNRRLWTLPARRAKNGVVHDVPLSTMAVSVLDQLVDAGKGDQPAAWPRRGLVFTTTGNTPISGYSAAKRRLDHLITQIGNTPDEPNKASAGLPPWRLHDLRRTVATGLQRLGVRFEVTEAVLNHVSGSRSGVAGVYQRHHWSDEKRDALEAWGDHVAELVGAKDAAKAELST